MTRRTFLCGLTLGTLAAPLAGEAQQRAAMPRVGVRRLLSTAVRAKRQPVTRKCSPSACGRTGSHAGYVEEHPETLYMDFEDMLTAIEEKGGHDSLVEAARIAGISSPIPARH